MTANKSSPSWSDVKARLADFDRGEMIKLIQGLYAASRENKVFLHTRFGLGRDPLEPYKDMITRWINPPDPWHPLSTSKARRAISDYRKASAQPEGLAELTVFYCEQVFRFLDHCGVEDVEFFESLVRVFDQALKYVLRLPESSQASFLVRLDRVRQLGHRLGYGVGDDFDEIWCEAGFSVKT